jgi:hypothetical protein
LRRFVQVAHECACLRSGHAFAGIYFNSFQRGEIDHRASIAHSVPETAVASAAHRHLQVLGLGKIQSARDVGWDSAAHDHRGMPVECAVEYQA